MKNETNLVKYRLLAPVYDAVFGAVLARARRQAMSLLDLEPGRSLLLVGVGTGQDLPLVPPGVTVTGIDLSPEMLDRARRKAAGRQVRLELMSAEDLAFPDRQFDVVALNLILSVVEAPRRALAEAARVLKDDGLLLVFDKFLPDDRTAGPGRRLLNRLTSLIGTDINRHFGDLIQGLNLTVVADHPTMFGGNYRAILLAKQ